MEVQIWKKWKRGLRDSDLDNSTVLHTNTVCHCPLLCQSGFCYVITGPWNWYNFQSFLHISVLRIDLVDGTRLYDSDFAGTSHLLVWLFHALFSSRNFHPQNCKKCKEGKIFNWEIKGDSKIKKNLDTLKSSDYLRRHKTFNYSISGLRDLIGIH